MCAASYVLASRNPRGKGMVERKAIGIREVKALQPGEIIWDKKVPAFGARRQRGPGVAYVLFYRTGDGRQRWHTIGRHGAPWTPDTARDEARRLLAKVAEGNDPSGEKSAARKAETVAELCDHYLADTTAGRVLTRRRVPKKASTLATDKGRIERHIKPLLGKLKVAAVSNDDIIRFMNAVADGETATRAKTANKRGLANVRGGKGTASRTVGLLGGIFSYAIKRRLRSDNPVRGTVRFADGERKRRLSDDEYAALGEALRTAADTIWPPALAATRFLALTGWRTGEALALKWSDVDLERRIALLSDTKTGHSARALSDAACGALRSLPRMGGPLVFPASRRAGRMTGFPKFWLRIAKLGGLPADVTPHTLRHSFASNAADLEYSELTIASLLGHRKGTVTAKYAHHADAVLLQAADTVAGRIAELMGDERQTGAVVPLRRSRASGRVST